ncbi:MAG: hypothetical protein GF364_02635 [Candidatus Lokiarchaeota archaeon]|nr:hypothetical protein [Candidatus Lokiarchaeota archaeon]
MEKSIRKSIIKHGKSNWQKNKLKKIAKSGLYEVWYTIIDDIKNQQAFWIRYTLLVPREKVKIDKDKTMEENIDALKGGGADLWFAYFDAKAPNSNFIIKKRYPLSNVEGSINMKDNTFRIIKIEESEIFIDKMHGNFKTASGIDVAWDLEFSHFQEAYVSVPGWSKTLGINPTLLRGLHSNMRISGKIKFKGKAVQLSETPGIQYHTFGDRYANPWVWASAHTFKENEDIWLDLGYKKDIEKASMGFFDGKTEFLKNKVHLMKKIKCVSSPTKASAEVEGKNVKVSAKFTVPKESLLGIEYLGPRGNRLYCYNSEVASCVLTYAYKQEDGSFGQEREIHAEDSVAFETLYKEPLPELDYLPWDAEENN